ncbi:hypothetical protein CRG98_018670 [Punica granatum]|uniref:Uncharacterized protein n=1 Tax=Punica granatum TaxID=22663 RepID=A0A2I0JZQ0_PUNGR|nr:hypothetical protein CRG98_018670 [Punica granatum]
MRGELGPFFDRQRDRVRSFVAGGMGHAMFVGAVACDLSWRDGGGMLARRGRTHSVVLVDVLSFAKKRVRSRDDAWLHGFREKLALLRKVHRSLGHGSPCRGKRVKVAFERAQHWKAPALSEGLAKTSIIERVCGSLRALFLDLSRTAFARAGSF